MELPLCIAALAVCFGVLAKVRTPRKMNRVILSFYGKSLTVKVDEDGFWYDPETGWSGWIQRQEDSK